jgi:hypothetical protein
MKHQAYMRQSRSNVSKSGVVAAGRRRANAQGAATLRQRPLGNRLMLVVFLDVRPATLLDRRTRVRLDYSIAKLGREYGFRCSVRP